MLSHESDRTEHIHSFMASIEVTMPDTPQAHARHLDALIGLVEHRPLMQRERHVDWRLSVAADQRGDSHTEEA
jgi:hypothetical protein